MSSILISPPRTIADLLERIGDVPLDRIRMQPPPGTAMPHDALHVTETDRPCELVDGVLVEKAMGHEESRLAGVLVFELHLYLRDHNLGVVGCPDALTRFDEDLVRIPDVSFIPYENIPPDADPSTPIPDWVPALVIEIVSRGNTKREIERKLRDYFDAGVQLVWCFYPQSRTVAVFTATDQSVTLDADGVLDGGTVLPGFTLSIRSAFDRASNTRKPG